MPQRILTAMKANQEAMTALFSLGVITYTGGTAADSGARSYVAQGAFTVFGLLVIYGVRYMIKRLDVQTTREAQGSADTAVVIRELKDIIVLKDEHYEKRIASLIDQHQREIVVLNNQHQSDEGVFRADRHKYRGRTQMCMARLYLLCAQGKITREDASIDFEAIEGANELQEIRHALPPGMTTTGSTEQETAKGK